MIFKRLKFITVIFLFVMVYTIMGSFNVLAGPGPIITIEPPEDGAMGSPTSEWVVYTGYDIAINNVDSSWFTNGEYHPQGEIFELYISPVEGETIEVRSSTGMYIRPKYTNYTNVDDGFYPITYLYVEDISDADPGTYLYDIGANAIADGIFAVTYSSIEQFESTRFEDAYDKTDDFAVFSLLTFVGKAKFMGDSSYRQNWGFYLTKDEVYGALFETWSGGTSKYYIDELSNDFTITNLSGQLFSNVTNVSYSNLDSDYNVTERYDNSIQKYTVFFDYT